jgi:hypothetical protein
LKPIISHIKQFYYFLTTTHDTAQEASKETKLRRVMAQVVTANTRGEERLLSLLIDKKLCLESYISENS